MWKNRKNKGEYKVIDHTADCMLKIHSNSLEGLFMTAGEALTAQIADTAKVERTGKRSIIIEQKRISEGLHYFLREILYNFEIEKMLFSCFEIPDFQWSQGDKTIISMRIDCFGEEWDEYRHGICNEIKAVTRHEFTVQKKGARWEAQILLDL